MSLSTLPLPDFTPYPANSRKQQGVYPHPVCPSGRCCRAARFLASVVIP